MPGREERDNFGELLSVKGQVKRSNIIIKKLISQPTSVAAKQAVKKAASGPIPSTMPVSGPGGPAAPSGFQPGVTGPPGLLGGLQMGFTGQVPGGSLLFGGVGQAIGRAGIGLGRLALRLPGTRQLAETIAGRATTLRPFFGRGPTLGQAAGFAGGVIAAETVLGAGERLLDLAARPFAGAGDVTTAQRGLATMQHGTGRAIQTLPGVGGMLPPGTTIVKVWNTGTAQFARLADGRIAVQKRDGTIKVYRPQKHIVIPRNPRVGTLIRADKRLQRLTTGLRKVVDRGRTRRK